MSSIDQGPITWIQPMFSNGFEQLFVNGAPTGVELASFSMSSVDDVGVVVGTASGQHVPHVVLNSADAPLSLGRFEIELEWQHVAEEPRAQAHQLVGISAAGILEIAIDAPIYDVWLGDDVRTTHVLSQSTAYGTTGVAFASRPARCHVTTSGTRVELTAVTGAPSSGEFQVSQTADSTSIVLGDPPISGAFTQLGYYPLLRCTEASISEDMNARNDWDVEVSFVTLTPVRSYS